MHTPDAKVTRNGGPHAGTLGGRARITPKRDACTAAYVPKLASFGTQAACGACAPDLHKGLQEHQYVLWPSFCSSYASNGPYAHEVFLASDVLEHTCAREGYLLGTPCTSQGSWT